MSNDSVDRGSVFDLIDEGELLEGSAPASGGTGKRPKYTYSLVTLDDRRPAYRSNIRGGYDAETGITTEDHYAYWTFGFRWCDETSEYEILSVIPDAELSDLDEDEVIVVDSVDDMSLVSWLDVGAEFDRFCEDHVMWHLADYLRRYSTDNAYDEAVERLRKDLRRQIRDALIVRSQYGAELTIAGKRFSFQAMDVRWAVDPRTRKRRRMGHQYWVRADAKTKVVGKRDSLIVSAKEPRGFINGRTNKR